MVGCDERPRMSPTRPNSAGFVPAPRAPSRRDAIPCAPTVGAPCPIRSTRWMTRYLLALAGLEEETGAQVHGGQLACLQ
jgi:hypothetical protein